MESTTSEIVFNKPSSDTVATSEVLSQIKKQSISVESVHSASLVAIADTAPDAIPDVIPEVTSEVTPDTAPDGAPSSNRTYINHVIDEKMIDIDNNNEKPIDHGDQEGLLFRNNYV